MTEIENQLFEFIVGIVGNDNIKQEMLLKEDLGLDSIKIVGIITKMSNKFKVNIFEFSDRDLIRMKTINDLMELFTSKIKV